MGNKLIVHKYEHPTNPLFTQSMSFFACNVTPAILIWMFLPFTGASSSILPNNFRSFIKKIAVLSLRPITMKCRSPMRLGSKVLPRMYVVQCNEMQRNVIVIVRVTKCNAMSARSPPFVLNPWFGAYYPHFRKPPCVYISKCIYIHI